MHACVVGNSWSSAVIVARLGPSQLVRVLQSPVEAHLSSREMDDVHAIVVANPAKKCRSGRYKPGTRKGQRDTRLTKGAEKQLRQELSEAKTQIEALERRMKDLEEELQAERSLRIELSEAKTQTAALEGRMKDLEDELKEERNLRIAYEADAVMTSGRLRSVYRELQRP